MIKWNLCYLRLYECELSGLSRDCCRFITFPDKNYKRYKIKKKFVTIKKKYVTIRKKRHELQVVRKILYLSFCQVNLLIKFYFFFLVLHKHFYTVCFTVIVKLRIYIFSSPEPKAQGAFLITFCP
jgi:hypothetical protein